MLYLLSSPIGNLKDISQRFTETLTEVDILFCEDTRVTGNLLNKLGIKKVLHRYDEHVEAMLIPKIINELKNERDIGLISDAGIPTLSDPGYKLVRECVKHNIAVINIPGPSAVTVALAVSGLPTDHFMFFGFLPKTEAHIKQVFLKMQQINSIQKTTFIFFESPHRLMKSLEYLNQLTSEVNIVVARELTKLHEEILRGNLLEIIHTLNNRQNIKGELTIVLQFNNETI